MTVNLYPGLVAVDYRRIGGRISLFLTGGSPNPVGWIREGGCFESFESLQRFAATGQHKLTRIGRGVWSVH